MDNGQKILKTGSMTGLICAALTLLSYIILPILTFEGEKLTLFNMFEEDIEWTFLMGSVSEASTEIMFVRFLAISALIFAAILLILFLCKLSVASLIVNILLHSPLCFLHMAFVFMYGENYKSLDSEYSVIGAPVIAMVLCFVMFIASIIMCVGRAKVRKAAKTAA